MRKDIKLRMSMHSELLEPSNLVTHRLKPKKKDDWQTHSMSQADKQISTNELLSSISTKLHPRSISISTDSKSSGFIAEKAQIRVSCLDQLLIPKFGSTYVHSLNFQDLQKKAAQRKILPIHSIYSCLNKNKKLCFEMNCQLKQKWKSKLMLSIKDTHDAEKYKNIVLTKKQQSSSDLQIDKDVTRSFPDRSVSKTKITLLNSTLQRDNLIQILRVVLKMLAICDSDVGYVQGMNLFSAIVVTHIKQIQTSFIFVQEVMKYGNMRKMYVNNFKNMKDLCNNLLHRHIKILIGDLYQLFLQNGVTLQFFIPFYLSMFSCVIDHSSMPCVIDQFMAKGFLFLDKLMLSMLCYLKKRLFECDPYELAYRLGASYIRSCSIDWGDVINMTQIIQLN